MMTKYPDSLDPALEENYDSSCYTKVGFLRVDIDQGCSLPRGYGIAYKRYDCYKAVCYPVPLNWLVWIIREIWIRLRDTPQGILDKARFDAYQRGWEDRNRSLIRVDHMGNHCWTEKDIYDIYKRWADARIEKKDDNDL